MKNAFIGVWLILALLFSGCTQEQQEYAPSESAGTTNTGVLSPAVIACGERGGSYEIVSAEDGSQSGKCVFPDGTVCTDEQYFMEGCFLG